MWFLAKNPIAVILESSWNRLTEVLLKNLPPLMAISAIAQETHVIFGGSTLLLMAISPFHPKVGGLMVLDTRTIFMQDIGQDVFFFLKNFPWKNHVESLDFTWIFDFYFNMKSWTSRPSEVRHASPPPISLLRGDPVPGTSSPEPTLGKLSGSFNQNGCPKMWIFTRKLSFVAIQNMETLEMYWFPTIFPLNHIIFGYPNKPLFFLSKSH